MNMSTDDVRYLAYKYYEPEGYNQLPHIKRVLSQAEKLAALRGKPLSRSELLAITLHDIGKTRKIKLKGKDHGETGAKAALDILRKRRESADVIKSVISTIADHTKDKTPPVSEESDLLRSADANKPDLAWYLRKSYNKMRSLGYTHNAAVKNAYDRVKAGYATFDAPGMYMPPLYNKLFRDDIKKEREAAAKLKEADVMKLIRKYDKAHPGESIYS